MTKFAPALTLGLILVVSAFSQVPEAAPTPPQDNDVVQITTNLIQLDAIVTGKDNKQVTNLRLEDFEVFENGKQREISFFSYVPLGGPQKPPPETKSAKKTDRKKQAAIPTTRLRAKEVRRAYAIVVDDLGISFENVPSLRRALRKFVNEDVVQGDLVAIVRTGRGSGALQSFTSDKRQLLVAIDKIRWNAYGRGGISTFDPIRTTLKEDLIDEQGNAPEGLAEDLAFEKQVGAIRRSNFEAGTLGALGYVIRGMNELPGRKSVILFSEGFTTISSDRERPNAIFDKLRLLVDYANRSSVTFYTIDPRGLRVAGMANAEDDIREVVPVDPNISKAPKLDAREAEMRDSQSTLRYLAYETGGVPFVNNNSLTQGLETAMEDQRGYYLIAYEPDEDTFDPAKVKYNDIKIRVKVDGLKVRTRNGFYAVADKPKETKAVTAQQQIYRAITSPFDAGDISLTLNTLFTVDERNNKYLQSLVFIKGKDLLFKKGSDGIYKANFDILAITFGDSNRPYNEASRNYTITLSEKNYQKALKRGFVYRLLVPVKEDGAYQFRVAVRDSASKRVGSASQFVAVPNLKKKRLALSSIVINRYSAKEWKTIRTGSKSQLVKEYDNSIDNALRVFRTGDVLQFGYEVYNAKTNREISLRTRLIKDGQVLLEGSPSPLDRSGAKNPSRIETLGAITLGKNLIPGHYVLQVIVGETKSKKRSATVTQWVEFEIER